MLKIGITGNIGCGKSSVSSLLIEKGHKVIDADLLSREIYTYEDVLKKMRIYFPQCVTDVGIDRKTLADIVFSDRIRLDILNEITHAKIKELTLCEVENCRKEKREVVFVDGALLYEAGFDSFLDKMVVVFCDEKIQVERIMKRDGIDIDAVYRRIENQMSQDEKTGRADFVIDNSGSFSDLETQIEKLEKKIKIWIEGGGKNLEG